MITHALLSHRVEHGRRLMTAVCGVQLIEPAHTRLQACTVWPGENPEAEETHPSIKVHFYASSREQRCTPRINVFITGTDIKRCHKAMSEYLARGVAQFHIITATDESAKAAEIDTSTF